MNGKNTPVCYIKSWPWRSAERTCNAECMDHKMADGIQFIKMCDAWEKMP